VGEKKNYNTQILDIFAQKLDNDAFLGLMPATNANVDEKNSETSSFYTPMAPPQTIL